MVGVIAMIINNVSIDILEQALAITSQRFSSNLVFSAPPRALNKAGKRWRVRLKVVRAMGPGGRLSFSTDNPRLVAAACWHAYGHFIDAVLLAAPNAEVRTSEGTITAAYGNWIDRPKGSKFDPVMHSQACHCTK